MDPRRALRALLLLSTLLCATAAAKVRVRIEGNDHVRDRKLKPFLVLPDRPEAVSPKQIQDWKSTVAYDILDLYHSLGYFDAAVHIDATPDPPEAERSKDWRIDVRVVEGVRYRYDTVRVITTDSTPSRVPAADLKAKAGKRFNRDVVARDVRTLVRGYGNQGFTHAQAMENLRPDAQAKRVAVDYLVTPGRPVVFDTLLLRVRRSTPGDSAPGLTRKDLLRKLLPLERGDTVHLDQTDKFTEKLRATRVFNFVRVHDSLLPDSSGRSALDFYGEEKIPGELRTSLFYETQYGPGVSVDVSHQNLSGRFHQGRVGGYLAQKKQDVYLGYGSALLFGSLIRYDNDFETDWYQNRHALDHAGMFGGDFQMTDASRFSRPLTSWSRVVSSAELAADSRLQADSTQGDSLSRLRETSFNWINTGFLTFLDEPATPTRGARFAFTWGNGGPFYKNGSWNALGYRHNWLEAQSAYYWPITPQFKVAARLDGGRFFGEGEVNSERFYLGGPRSVRAFAWRSLCPVKINGLCQDAGVEPEYYLTSFELRLDLFDWTYANPKNKLRYLRDLEIVPFTDYGRVWQVGQAASPTGEGIAYGLGFRYLLFGIFNLRVDYAMGHNGDGDPSHALVIDLAQAF